MMPAFSHFFLKRRRALSKDSPSFTLIPGNPSPPLRPFNSVESRMKEKYRTRPGSALGAKFAKAVYGRSLGASSHGPSADPPVVAPAHQQATARAAVSHLNLLSES